jgi:hypothetical protein
MQKRLGILGIFLMVLMFVFSSGFVFAENSFVSYSSTSKVGWEITSAEITNNNIEINYMNNLESRDSCKTNERTFMWVPFATEYRGLFLVTLFVPNSFDNESGFDSFLYDNLSDRGKSENETEDTLKKYERYLKSNDPTFMNELNSYVSGDKYFYIVKIENDFKQNKIYTHNIDLSIINELDKFGKVYIYLYDHCGSLSSFYHNDYKISKNLAKAVYIFSDGQKENSKKETSTSIKLSSSIEVNKIKLDSNVTENVNVYYTLDDFNLENHFKLKFVEFNNDKEKLKKYLSSNSWNINQSGVNFTVTKYNSPVSLSSGQKLNAIAVNYDNFNLSNYLEGITLSSSESSQSSSLNKFSINFKEDIKTDNVICEKETKICYVKLNQNIDLNLIANKMNDGNVYFAINNLAKNSNASFNNPTLISEEIQLGNNLVNYNSKNTEFKVNLSQSTTGNYIISSKQDNTNVDKLYFVFLPDNNFENLIKYKTLQKIINNVYCEGCKIPDWMPFGIITDNITQESVVSDFDCKYTDEYQILCDFNIFDIEKKIGTISIASSAGTFNPKDTYYLEIKSYYDDKKSTFNKDLYAYKLFESEKNNFNLTENETAIFFSIIGGESSFLNDQAGDQGESIGLAQINKPIWRTQQGFENLKPYLPSEVNTVDKYYNYFDESGSDLNKSLYLGLAVFKYNLNYAKNNIFNFNSKYTDVDRAFIMFYAHQFNIRDTKTFFNTVNLPSDKNNIIIDCVNNKTQSSSEKRLGCVATVGSVRKIGWYLFYLNK